MDEYTVVVLLTLFGFLALAFVLLAPVYFFLKREEKLGDEWTEAARTHRLREPRKASNGAGVPDPAASGERSTADD